MRVAHHVFKKMVDTVYETNRANPNPKPITAASTLTRRANQTNPRVSGKLYWTKLATLPNDPTLLLVLCAVRNRLYTQALPRPPSCTFRFIGLSGIVLLVLFSSFPGMHSPGCSPFFLVLVPVLILALVRSRLTRFVFILPCMFFFNQRPR